MSSIYPYELALSDLRACSFAN